MNRIISAVFAVIFAISAPFAALAKDDEPGDFDYYVLALSWNASWCEREGDERGAPQCAPRHDYGFTMHGLWPQHEKGWPEYCRKAGRDPSKRESAAMEDIMGSAGLAWYQWKKHGRCTGLDGPDYYALAREAYGRISRPAILRQLEKDVRIAPDVLEEAFLEANPGLTADGVTIACRDGFFTEARICLTRDLEPRSCAPDTVKDCRASSVRFPAMR